MHWKSAGLYIYTIPTFQSSSIFNSSEGWCKNCSQITEVEAHMTNASVLTHLFTSRVFCSAPAINNDFNVFLCIAAGCF